MKDAFELAGAIITGLGGGGVIVFALSSWLGKVWANRILEGEKAEHAKEIENYKSELNKELKKISTIQDKALHISKAQYDNEYKIYHEIWEKLNECILFTKQLYPSGMTNMPTDEKQLEEFQRDKYNRFSDAFNQFSLIIDKFAPFYKKQFFDVFVNIRRMCGEIGNIFKMYEFDVKYSMTFVMARDTKMSSEDYKKVYITFHAEIDEIKTKLQEEIREYLLSLQLVE